MTQEDASPEFVQLALIISDLQKTVTLLWNSHWGLDAEARTFHDRLCEIEKKIAHL